MLIFSLSSVFFLQKPAGFFSPFWNNCCQPGWRWSFGFSFWLREWALRFLVNLFASLFLLKGFYVLYLHNEQSCKISIFLLLEMLVSSCLLYDIIGQPGKGSVSTHCYGAHCHLVLRRTYHLLNLMLPMRCQSFILMTIGRSSHLCKYTEWKVTLRDPPVPAVKLQLLQGPLGLHRWLLLDCLRVLVGGSYGGTTFFPCDDDGVMVLWSIIKDLHIFW